MNQKNKIASIQISFSWIFMIIVGTFFFILAYNIIGNYSENENLKSDLLLKQTFRSILNNVGRTAGIESGTIIPLSDPVTHKSIFQNKKVEIKCINNLSILSLNGNLNGKNDFLKNYPIFMTTIDEGKRSYSYILEESFKMPFKISNLVAIVSKKNLIILDSNSKISAKIMKKFNKIYTELTYRKENFTQMDNSYFNSLKDEINKKSYSSVVFVSDSDKTLNSGFIDNLNIYSSWVKIKQSNIPQVSNITIKDKSGEKTYENIDLDNSLPLITMAIFSKKDTFDCSYNLLMNSITPIYSFYINKTSYFINDLSNYQKDKICPSLESNFEKDSKYKTLRENLVEIKTDIKTKGKIYNAPNLYNKLVLVKNSQRDLENFNCPYIY